MQQGNFGNLHFATVPNSGAHYQIAIKIVHIHIESLSTLANGLNNVANNSPT